VNRTRWQNNPDRLPVFWAAMVTSPTAFLTMVCGGTPEPGWSFSVRWENDTFGGTDRFYTDGISLALFRMEPRWLRSWTDRQGWPADQVAVSFEAGQIMVTPSDTHRVVPDPRDRPYAGLLYASASLHLQQRNTYHGLKFITGVVGPWSLAEDTQKWVHERIGSAVPQGWGSQLHNEPILNLVYEHRRKYRLWGDPDGPAVEVLPLANVMLGNVLTQGQLGGQVRLGYRIPDDFGTTLMRGMVHLPPAPRRQQPGAGQHGWSVYLFGGVNGNLVARNITLDGNTWKDSPSVDKEWWVPAAEVGGVLETRRWQCAFTYVFWGREFKGQPDLSEFGALTLSWRF
jgi:hypothetical protein